MYMLTCLFPMQLLRPAGKCSDAGGVMMLCEDEEKRDFRPTDRADVLQTAAGVRVSLVKGSIVSQKVSFTFC